MVAVVNSGREVMFAAASSEKSSVDNARFSTEASPNPVIYKLSRHIRRNQVTLMKFGAIIWKRAEFVSR